ncbi:MAG: tRNA (adenosine(37)-N6)-dimethylallyltransferase MiaA [Bdellovibrionales bacterium]|nr:tRNA (adenosine(37)-N6)-dimethylallyltransferase MiaA [Bdellovibrionales bacterium]
MTNLIFIVGATATGKTNWAIKWAQQSQIDSPSKKTGILNADSIQIYKNLNKGSAKPDFLKYPEINFYLFDRLKAPELCTAGFFRKEALKILTEKLPTEKIFVVGGSGFYLQALEKGMYPIKNSPFKIKKTSPLLTHSLKEAYQDLKKKDPKEASKISPNDKYRILRALELISREDKTLSQIKKEFKKQSLPWNYIKIGIHLSKQELLKKVRQRTQNMLKTGFIEEVESLLAQGLKSWRALNSIGYKQVQKYLEGSVSKENLASSIISSTMHLAKKQKTWFKKDKNILWFDGNSDPLKIYKKLF